MDWLRCCPPYVKIFTKRGKATEEYSKRYDDSDTQKKREPVRNDAGRATNQEPAVKLPIETAVLKAETVTVDKREEVFGEPAVKLPTNTAIHKPVILTVNQPDEKLKEPVIKLPVESAVHKPVTLTATKPNEKLDDSVVKLPIESAVHKPVTLTGTKLNEKLDDSVVKLPIESAVHKPVTLTGTKPNEKLDDSVVKLPVESAVHKPVTSTATKPNEKLDDSVVKLPIESAVHKPVTLTATKPNEKLDDSVVKLPIESAVHKPVTLTATKPNEKLDDSVVKLPIESAVRKPITLTAVKPDEKLEEPVVKLPIETAVNKPHTTTTPIKLQDVEVKLDDKLQAVSPTEVKTYQSSFKTSSTVTSISNDGTGKPVVQTTVTSKTVVTADGETPEVHEETKTFTGDKFHFSTTAPTSINKEELASMSVKEIRSQRTSKIETKRETSVSSGISPSADTQEPMALLGALKYLKPTGESLAETSTVTKTVSTTSKVNGEVRSQTVVSTVSTSNGTVNGSSPTSPVASEDKSKNRTISSDSTQGTSKISSIPVSKIRPPSGRTSETSPTKPVNGSVTISEAAASEGSDVGNSTSEVTSPESDEQDGVFDEQSKDGFAFTNLKSDFQKLFYDFSSYNDDIIEHHQLLANTRTKQLQQIEKWLESDSEAKVMVVTGAGGVGKTTLTAEVCRKYKSSLAGYHFFRHNSSNVYNNNLRDVLVSLAYHFCDVFPNYVMLLPGLEKLRDLMGKDDLPELYNALLFYPFTNEALQRNNETNMLIVIDALDECDQKDTSVLIDVVNNLNDSCPPWLSILVSCRADGSIIDKLQNVGKVEIKRKETDNLSDIKRYLKQPLGQYIDRISLDGGLTTLTKKTQGSFTCAHIYSKRLADLPANTKIAMREVDGIFVDGLEANCLEILKAYKEKIPADKSLKNAYMTMTSVIACAREPLSLEFVFDIVGAKYFEQCKEAIREIGPLINNENERVEFINHCIVEWLFDAKAGEVRLDREIGRQELANLCAKWITGIIDGDLELDPSLKAYALKYSIYHLTDVRGNSEVIGKILCSLKYAREKLCLPGISLAHLLDDFDHQHMQTASDKIVSLKEYMKKYHQIWEQIRFFEKFIYDKREEISACPKFVLHIAANYSKLDRIQQNAKAELESEPWIEDLTAVPETNCIIKNLGGSIKSMDLSPDGKTVAVVTKDEDYNVKLHIINSQTGEERTKPIDIKSLNDRVGLLAKFMPDGNNIFVGSLTTFISKQGKPVPSGLDATTVDLKEKYSIECCDVSARYFALGLTTFPWGGRSLHLSVFDMKTKKCLNTLEILRFRFGGSAQFCIKSVGMATERPLVCACVKQSTKAQLRVIVWNITKFQVVNSIDVSNDDITKCLFVGDHTVLLGGGMRSTSTSKSNVPIVSEYWCFKEVTNKSSHPWDASEQSSLFAGSADTTLACRWYSASGSAIIEQWQGDDIKGKPIARYTIRGLSDVVEMQTGVDVLLFVANDELYLFNVADLEPLDSKDETRIPNLNEIIVDSVAFLPKSDTLIITAKRDGYYNVYLCDLSLTEPTLVPTTFEKITPAVSSFIDGAGQFTLFRGPSASTERCFPSADGNYLFFNAGDHVKVWDRVHNTTKNIPTLKDLKETPVYKEYEAVKAIASVKDNFLAVIYGQIPNKVFLYDIRSCNLLRKISLDVGEDRAGVVTDLSFMPATGFLITYHRDKDNTLAAWNSRTGDKISEESLILSYAKTSQALDRLVISARKSKAEGKLLLRNSDNKFFKKLPVGNSTWIADNNNSDVEFSADGTILVGVCQESDICRVWNAANGEVLQDLPGVFSGATDVIGMLTNTHVLFHDDRLQAMDVASGELIAVLPLEHQVDRRFTTRGLRISTRGSVVSGATTGGNLCVFTCHNFATVKRKTTLQRMKSFRK